MLQPDRAAAIFADARDLYADATEILELGKPRIAAEAAWGATKRATDALILARTGREPSGMGQTSGGIRRLARADQGYTLLRLRFQRRVGTLHANCFYTGNCPSPDLLELLIRDTNLYIRQAQVLAGIRL